MKNTQPMMLKRHIALLLMLAALPPAPANAQTEASCADDVNGHCLIVLLEAQDRLEHDSHQASSPKDATDALVLAAQLVLFDQFLSRSLRDGVLVGDEIKAQRDPATAKKMAMIARLLLPNVCIPGSANLKQMRQVLKKWLNDNPSKLDLPAFEVFTNAYRQHFPCSPTSH